MSVVVKTPSQTRQHGSGEEHKGFDTPTFSLWRTSAGKISIHVPNATGGVYLPNHRKCVCVVVSFGDSVSDMI